MRSISVRQHWEKKIAKEKYGVEKVVEQFVIIRQIFHSAHKFPIELIAINNFFSYFFGYFVRLSLIRNSFLFYVSRQLVHFVGCVCIKCLVFFPAENVILSYSYDTVIGMLMLLELLLYCFHSYHLSSATDDVSAIQSSIKYFELYGVHVVACQRKQVSKCTGWCPLSIFMMMATTTTTFFFLCSLSFSQECGCGTSHAHVLFAIVVRLLFNSAVYRSLRSTHYFNFSLNPQIFPILIVAFEYLASSSRHMNLPSFLCLSHFFSTRLPFLFLTSTSAAP